MSTQWNQQQVSSVWNKTFESKLIAKVLLDGIKWTDYKWTDFKIFELKYGDRNIIK